MALTIYYRNLIISLEKIRYVLQDNSSSSWNSKNSFQDMTGRFLHIFYVYREGKIVILAETSKNSDVYSLNRSESTFTRDPERDFIVGKTTENINSNFLQLSKYEH